MRDRKEQYKKYNRTRNIIRLSFSKEEKEFIDKLAEKKGVRASQLLKEFVVEELENSGDIPKKEETQEPCKSSISEDLKNLTLQVRKIGNNLNQIAHRNNIFGKLGGDIFALKREHNRLVELLKEKILKYSHVDVEK